MFCMAAFFLGSIWVCCGSGKFFRSFKGRPSNQTANGFHFLKSPTQFPEEPFFVATFARKGPIGSTLWRDVAT